MTPASAAALWDQLRDAQVVSGDPPEAARTASPWYVRAMLGVAGWIAALFGFAFVAAALAFLLRSPAAAIVTGLMTLVGVWALFRGAGDNDFVGQFGMAASFAGQAMIVFGIFSEGKNATADWASLAVLEAALVWLLANYVHRVWSAFAAGLVTAILLSTLGGYFLSAGLLAVAVAVVWLNELTWARHDSIVRPLGYGLTLALLVVQGSVFGHHYLRSMIYGMSGDVMPAFIGPALSGLVLIVVIATLVTRIAGSPAAAHGVPLVAAIAIAGISFQAPGLATGLMIVVLGFANGSLTLLGLGAAALVGYLSTYYYLLGTTLLVKSLTLGLAGGVLLLMRAGLSAARPSTEESRVA